MNKINLVNMKSENYFVSISTELLFSTKFKSHLAIWVYVYLKLKHNYHLQHKPNYCFKIDSKEIIRFFQITKPTFHRIIKELQGSKLLERTHRNSYNLKNDMDGQSKYVNIYYNFFQNLFEQIQNYHWGYNNRASGKLPLVYYFLIYNNKHFMNSDDLLESSTPRTTVGKKLGIDTRTLSKIYSIMWGLDLITVEGEKIYTKYGHGVNRRKTKDSDAMKLRRETNIFENESLHDIEAEDNTDRSKETEIGWIKSYDGKKYLRLVSVSGYDGVVYSGSKPADGIPPTEEETQQANKLKKYRKSYL